MTLTQVIASLQRAASSIETIPSLDGEINALDALAGEATKAAEIGGKKYSGPRGLLLYSACNALKMVHEHKPQHEPQHYRQTAGELVEVSRALPKHPQSTDLVELCCLLLNRQARAAEVVTSGRRSADEQTAALAAAAPRPKLAAGEISFLRTGDDGDEGRLEACLKLPSPADPDAYFDIVKAAAGLLVDLRRFRLVGPAEIEHGGKLTYALWRFASSDKERHAWRKELAAWRGGKGA